MNVDTACADFIEYCRLERGLSANTLAAYEQDLNEFRRAFSGKMTEAVTGQQLVQFAQSLSAPRGLSPSTIKRRLACLRTMFARLRRQRIVNANPFEDVDLRIRIPGRLPRCLGLDEVRTLLRLAKADPTTYVALLLLVATGVRISELTAIRLRDIQFDQLSIRIVGKGNRERRVFLPDSALITILRDYISSKHGATFESERRLLTNSRGRPASSACLRGRIRALGSKAKLTRAITPHMFRHTAATTLMEAGVDIRFVQRLLGHRSISTTQIYTHVSDRALRAAIVAANVYSTIKLSEG